MDAVGMLAGMFKLRNWLMSYVYECGLTDRNVCVCVCVAGLLPRFLMLGFVSNTDFSGSSVYRKQKVHFS